MPCPWLRSPKTLPHRPVEIQCPFPNSPESFPSARQEKKPRAHSPHQPKQEVDSKQTNLCEAAALPNPLRGRCHEHLSSASWRPCSLAAVKQEKPGSPGPRRRSAVQSTLSALCFCLGRSQTCGLGHGPGKSGRPLESPHHCLKRNLILVYLCWHVNSAASLRPSSGQPLRQTVMFGHFW